MRVIKRNSLRCAVASLFCAAPLGLSALVFAEGPAGYLTDSVGNPVRASQNQCVHTRGWEPNMRFADCEPAPARAVEAPAPQAVEAPAAAVVAPAAATEPSAPPPAPLPQNVPFRVSMDAFFDFDQATLRAEGRAALDELADRLSVTRYENLTIVGHADRIGPEAYNQMLSERRANAMREYLLLQGIDAGKISSWGVGESEPVTSCDALRGKKLIACLQPDRSAQLTAVGSELRVAEAGQAK